ncbi:hypothetical protein Anas_01640 [Armadillidium nasatum]|uniref:Uncharacterized protein n=1 Tax=Armadillidium nasatum TaxID=96803 RepID=A0A5N5TJ07_9CRUS|nr:hypothetical protein Anas_01640 [Armadillidium nasatum]
MQDRLVPPDEEAAYWVEYVMRHKGAPHIMSPTLIFYILYHKFRIRLFYIIDVYFISYKSLIR